MVNLGMKEYNYPSCNHKDRNNSEDTANHMKLWTASHCTRVSKWMIRVASYLMPCCHSHGWTTVWSFSTCGWACAGLIWFMMVEGGGSSWMHLIWGDGWGVKWCFNSSLINCFFICSKGFVQRWKKKRLSIPGYAKKKVHCKFIISYLWFEI